MVDVTAGSGAAAPGSRFPSLSEIGRILKRGDLALAFGVLTILVVLIMPLPSVVLDLFLAISITGSASARHAVRSKRRIRTTEIEAHRGTAEPAGRLALA